MVDSPSPSSLGDSQVAVSLPNVIVIQPGSKYLRIGRASDPEPLAILHAIARKRKSAVTNGAPDINDTTNGTHRDTLISLLAGNSIEEKLPPEVESARLQLCHTLQTSLKPDGSQRYITPNEQVSAFNKISKVQVITDKPEPPCNSGRETGDQETKEKDTIVGDDVVTVAAASNSVYNIHFPWRRGQLNLHSGIGGSRTSVLNDLWDIWEWAISDKLGIPSKNRYMNYRVIIIIPVMFDRVEAKELMDLVLNRLQFGHALLVQDHVCATFGSALSFATVVDVGDQRISISCVDEGRSLPETRIELKYGGGDLTPALWNLMSQSNAPFKLDLTSLWDLQFLNKLKEDLCHFDLSRCGPEEHSVVWDKPGESTVRYNILLGDELLIVPLSYFNPDLLRGSVDTVNLISVWKSGHTEIYDDPCDATFIAEYAHMIDDDDDDGDDEEMLEDVKDIPLLPSPAKKIDVDQLLGIDQAILHSIDSCGTEELKRRFYSVILVVGGGFKFHGLGSWLQNKIALNIPRSYRTTDTVEVITMPKGKDPSIAAWRGGALISNLETTAEVWISETEWNTHGSRILRERSLAVF